MFSLPSVPSNTLARSIATFHTVPLFTRTSSHSYSLSVWSSYVSSSDLSTSAVPLIDRYIRSPLLHTLTSSGRTSLSNRTASKIGRASCRERVKIVVLAGPEQNKSLPAPQSSESLTDSLASRLVHHH